eukprot:3484634-Amphidinium_carterae.1
MKGNRKRTKQLVKSDNQQHAEDDSRQRQSIEFEQRVQEHERWIQRVHLQRNVKDAFCAACEKKAKGQPVAGPTRNAGTHEPPPHTAKQNHYMTSFSKGN